MGVNEALEKLPARLAADEIHVALTIVIGLDGKPCLWVADRRGHPHAITAYKPRGEVPAERRSKVSGWSAADLRLAADYIGTIDQLVRYGRVDSLSDAHHRALTELDERDQRRLTAALVDAMVDPYHCICRRRFATQRGLDQHIARARRGNHARNGE